MSRITFVLVVLLFGSTAAAGGNSHGASDNGNNGQGHRNSSSFDGQSDRRARVCDVVTDKTRGLHGLCVAYCEAKGVDSLFTKYNFRPSEAKRAAFDKEAILERYNARRRTSDPAMPCIPQDTQDTQDEPTVAACPCWSAQTLEVGNWLNRGAAAKCLNALNSDELEAGASGSDFAKILALNVNVDANYCVFVDETSSTEMLKLIPEADASNCRAQVKTACEALNLAG